MKKRLILVLGISLLTAAFVPAYARAEVNVSVTVPLPGLVIPAPPPMLVIPGTYVYYPPDVGVEIFFYRGYWYRPHGGGWYIASGYNGPWRTIGMGRVPRPLLHLPAHYRSLPPRHDRIPHADMRRNWRSWEHDRRWDERRHEDRGDRGRGEGQEGHRGMGRGR
ncbi:MAG TPA: hypothetical protein VK654_03025 [Nitrospirota bacterium]|nr:hypothetical protein [Nitrospirota bacterium]